MATLPVAVTVAVGIASISIIRELIPGVRIWSHGKFYYIDTYEPQYTSMIDEFILSQNNNINIRHSDEMMPNSAIDNDNFPTVMGQHCLKLNQLLTIKKDFWFHLANLFEIYFIKLAREIDGTQTWYYAVWWPYIHEKWYKIRHKFNKNYLEISFVDRIKMSNITPNLKILNEINIITKKSELNSLMSFNIDCYRLNSIEFNPSIMNGHVMCPTILYESQLKLLKKIIKIFLIQRNVKVLISGTPGTGKSVMGRIVKYYLDKVMKGYNSHVYEGLDFSVPRFSLDNQILKKTLNPNKPSILVIDEVDIFFEQSLNPQAGRPFQGMAHASNRQSMLKTLDNIKDTPNVIAIYTTNVPLDTMKTKYEAYIRTGRVDILETF